MVHFMNHTLSDHSRVLYQPLCCETLRVFFSFLSIYSFIYIDSKFMFNTLKTSIMKATLNIVTTSKAGAARFGFTVDCSEEQKAEIKKALGEYYAESEAGKPVYFTSLSLGIEHGETVPCYISKSGKFNLDNRAQVVRAANRKAGF